jgi:pimeloyl-ACP methyl ester carboxylesterase
MFYRKASPPSSVKPSGQTILLLHGRSFKSETWQKLGTMHLMAGIGHLVIAVDLPGWCARSGYQSGCQLSGLRFLVVPVSKMLW